jgi:hypothetical protein
LAKVRNTDEVIEPAEAKAEQEAPAGHEAKTPAETH